MVKKKLIKRRRLKKTFFSDKDGQWIFTWRNGKIVNTKLIPRKKQPNRKKKKKVSLVPGQFV